MQTALAWIAFGLGWPVLLVASVWMWSKSTALQGHAKLFLNVSLISFYALGYTCTVYWLGKPWYLGVLPALVVFLVLMYFLVRAFLPAGERPATTT